MSSLDNSEVECLVETQDEVGALPTPRTNKQLNNQRYTQKLRDKVYQAKNEPCVDCGNIYPPYIMEFDHVPGRGEKVANISTLISKRKVTLLMEELDKCDVICANCHRTRTYVRGLS